MNARQLARYGLKLVRYYVEVPLCDEDGRKAGGWSDGDGVDGVDVGCWGVDVVFDERVIAHIESYGERSRYYVVRERSETTRKARGKSGLAPEGYKKQREAVAALLERSLRLGVA